MAPVECVSRQTRRPDSTGVSVKRWVARYCWHPFQAARGRGRSGCRLNHFGPSVADYGRMNGRPLVMTGAVSEGAAAAAGLSATAVLVGTKAWSWMLVESVSRLRMVAS